MRRLLAAVAVASLAPVAAARAEEGAKSYDLHTWNAVWKAGDLATLKGDDSSTQKLDITQPGPDGNPVTEKREQAEHTTATWVVKCLEATPEGALKKALVFVADWTHTETTSVDGKPEGEPKADMSLKGVHVEETVQEGAHSYTVLTPKATPSDAATQWLAKRFGAEQKSKWLLDLDHFGRPAGPVKVGDSWKGDPAKLGGPLPLELPESSLKLTLKGVEDGRMRLTADMRLKVTGFPLGEGPDAPVAPFTSGGSLEADGTFTHSMAPHTFDCDGTFAGTLKGTAELEGVVKVVMELGHRSEVHSKTGGDLPAPPTAKPADAPK